MNCINCSTVAKHKNDVLPPPQNMLYNILKKLLKNSQAIVTLVNRKRGTI